MTTEELTLWQELRNGDPDARQALANFHAGLVHHTIKKMWTSISHYITRSDAIGSATVGLLQAIDSFKIERGLRFSTFAAQRIRGAVLDSIRASDHLGRQTRKYVKELRTADNTLLNTLGRSATAKEMCTSLNMKESKYQKIRMVAESDAMIDHADVEIPYIDAAFEDFERKDQIAAMIKHAKLSEKESEYIQLSFYRDMSHVEIGKLWGLTESRVSQIHKKVLAKLKQTALV